MKLQQINIDISSVAKYDIMPIGCKRSQSEHLGILVVNFFNKLQSVFSISF